MQLARDAPALLILNAHQVSGKLAQILLRLLALSDIAIDLQHYGITLIFFLQRPAAVYNPFLAVTAYVDEFTFPPASAEQLLSDFVEEHRVLALQKFRICFSQCFTLGPAVHL